MSADATAGRWHYPSVPIDDPGRALGDLADTIPLVDDIIALVDGLPESTNAELSADWHTARRELRNLRQRLEAVHARLVS